MVLGGAPGVRCTSCAGPGVALAASTSEGTWWRSTERGSGGTAVAAVTLSPAPAVTVATTGVHAGASSRGDACAGLHGALVLAERLDSARRAPPLPARASPKDSRMGGACQLEKTHRPTQPHRDQR